MKSGKKAEQKLPQEGSCNSNKSITIDEYADGDTSDEEVIILSLLFI